MNLQYKHKHQAYTTKQANKLKQISNVKQTKQSKDTYIRQRTITNWEHKTPSFES
jgi:hypothetical protein